MPTVPNLDAPTVQAEALPGRANPRIATDASPQDFGAGLAQGLEAVGAAGSEQEAKLKQQNDQLRVIDANTQLEAAKTAMLYGKPDENGNPTGGAFSLHGTDAMNMPDRILPQYNLVAQNIASTLTPDQQRLFQAHIAQGKTELNTALNRYEYEESNRLADQVFTSGTKQTITNATVGWQDPATIAKSRQDLQALVTMQGDREGWTADERSQQLDKMLAEMHFNVVDRQLADGKPQAALAYFKAIRDTGELTGEQSHQLGAQIDAAFREHQADNQTALLSQLRDVSTAGINGMAVPPSSLPSKASVLAAFPADGEKRWSAMMSDIAMGADIKNMAGMTPDQIRAKVEGYRPQQVTGAADEFDRYNAVGAAAQRVLSQRAADPRQYQIDNKLGSHDLDFSDMSSMTSELKSRIASQQQDSQRLGGYVPPLTKQESAQFAQRLESMPPADRLKTLAALNQGLSDDRGFQEVMHQVLPGSPVTAIVGSQLGQSNPNRVPVWFDHQFAPNPTDQTRILAGEQLINPQGSEKQGETKGGIKGYPMPSDSGPNGLREQFSTKVGDLFRDRPELADAYYTAFKGAYAQLLSEKGDFSGNGNSSLRDQAMKMVIGNTTSVNGRSVSVPQGMDPTRFQSILEAAIDVKAKAAGVPDGYQNKIAGYTVSEIGGLGSGRYQLLNGNAPLVNPDGRGPFIVDLHNQYMAATGAKPAAADAARIAQAQSGSSPGPAPVQPADSVGGTSKVGRADLEREPVVKPPAVTGLSRGGKGGRAHPSQGPEAE